MDKFKIEDILKHSSDKSSFNSGFHMYKKNLVTNEYINIDSDIITFYGDVRDEYHFKNYTSMVSINLGTREIFNISCDCMSTSKYSKFPICNHIIAVVLKGCDNDFIDNKKHIYDEKNIINPKINFNFSQSRNGYIGADLCIDGVNKVEYRKIFNSFKENKKLHSLESGRYIDLNDKDLESALNLIDILGIYTDFDKMKIPTNKSLYLEDILDEEKFDFVNGRNYINNISKKYKSSKINKFDIPTSLSNTLRNYQIDGFNFLSTLSDYGFGGILADEMGLGKTIQLITFLLSKKNENKNSIIVTPTALIYNWKNEIEKFAPTLNVLIIHGNKSDREKSINNIRDYDIALTTYTSLKNDMDKYSNLCFDYCIIDEAQNIKNPDSIISKLIKEINAKIRFALTGTPIENNLLELWSIFDFIMPGYLYDRRKFQNIFRNDDTNINELKKLIAPFMLRRLKKDVISELPDKIEQKLIIELEKEHKRVYNGLVKLIKNKVIENKQDNITIFSHLTKLRQITLSPDYMVKNYTGSNSKIDVLLNIIEESGDKKILVFSQFTKVLNLIGERLSNIKIPFSYLDGKTSAKDRINLVNEFNDNDKKIFLISLKAGGTGLNLTSASIVIHFDPWWNPAVENQASDRAHRLGQKDVVNIIKIIAKDTIEERVISLQESKRELIEDVLDGNLENSNTLKNLSRDDLIELFINN
ncbi:MAG: DEAD/DEAH box helicase [Romboutsia sp.]